MFGLHFNSFAAAAGKNRLRKPVRKGGGKRTVVLSMEELEARLVPSSMPLHVAGPQLQDSTGNPVVLRGVNIPSLEYYAPGVNVLQSVDVALGDWHANLIRLPVNEDFWFGYDGSPTPDQGAAAAYRQLVDQVIQKASDKGVYVMLDLHWSDMGVRGSYNDQHDLPDDLSTAFWQNAASRYANNATVLFDPYNEPHDQDWGTWRNGGQVTEKWTDPNNKQITVTQTYTSPGLQGLLDTIRGTGAQNLVAPEGLDWGDDLSGITAKPSYALTDSAHNLMYQIHLYPGAAGNDAQRDALVDAVAANSPLYVGEWGADPRSGLFQGTDAEAGQFNQTMLAWLNRHQYSWTAWSLNTETYPALISDFNQYTPTTYFGQYVKDALIAGNGPGKPPPVTPPAPGVPSSVPTAPVAYTPDTVFKLGDYWIYVPASYDPTHQTPTKLFVWSHGGTGSSAADITWIHATDGGPSYITIALDGEEGGYWDMNTDPARVVAAIADVKTHFNIDPQRVVLGGYSSGGDLSYNVAFTHSTEIAGVLAVNTSPFRDTGLTQEMALAAPFHFHIVHVAHTEDVVYPIDGVRSEINAVKAAGLPGDNWGSLQFIEQPGTHDDWASDFQTYLLPHLGDGWTSPSTAPATPAAPAGLQATAGNGQVTLTWSASAGASSYTIFRGTAAGAENAVPYASGITTLSFIDTAAVNGTTYFYVVVAVNAAGSSARSAEVSASPQGPINPGPTANERYVEAAYRAVLGRDADPAGLATWSALLNSGAPPSLVAEALTHSAEYYSNFVTAAYARYLGRQPDAVGLAGWVRAMQHGLTDEQLESSFIGSDEYIQDHGGTGRAWVEGMYRDLLGRTPAEVEVDGWVNALAGGVPAQEVAYGFAASAEREGQRVTADYLTYLGRQPAPSEVNGWVGGFLSGLTNEDVVAGFVGSPEYYQEHSA